MFRSVAMLHRLASGCFVIGLCFGATARADLAFEIMDTSMSAPNATFTLVASSVSNNSTSPTFVLTNAGGVTPGSQAEAGFLAAAQFWSNVLHDPVTINLDVGFSSLGGSTLGQAGSTRGSVNYSVWRTAMLADGTSIDDTTMINNLPTGSSFSVYLNGTSNSPHGTGSATPYLDNDGDANNTTVRITQANAKALGFAVPAGSDASITFNSDFSFDFDPSDGISPGQIDFVGVAIHEIGHALGFVSGVDILDSNSPNGSGLFFPDNAFTFVSGLDFLRFSADSQAAGADIDWTADARAKYVSIDGGTTAATTGSDHWSTGVVHGDGRQASHWKDGLGLGIMDPTSAPAGFPNIVTALDIQALDVIGWDVVAVPEPAQWLMFTMCGLVFAACTWRRQLEGT